MKHWWLLVFAVLVNTHSICAQTPGNLIAAIDARLIPVKTLSPDSSFDDLQSLRPFLKDKNLIAIGEATHATHEFFVYKHRMLKFLVTQLGFKTFVIEANFSGTQSMNNYVLYGKGDAYSAIQDMGIATWMTREFVDMVNWLKQYNSTQADHNKVKFYGCDMQGTYGGIKLLREYLGQNHQNNDAIEKGFTALLKYPWIPAKDKSVIDACIEALDKLPFNNTDSALYRQYIVALEQSAGYVFSASKFFPARQSDLRDKFMAENCEWIYNHTDHNKMMIWAHNSHIIKAKDNLGYVRMGMHLANKYKEQYYAMGFAFNAGYVNQYNYKESKDAPFELPPAMETSADHVFAGCRLPNFILDFNSAATDQNINRFLNQTLPSYNIGAEYLSLTDKDIRNRYVQHKLFDTYDALIFIKQTTAAKHYDAKQ